MRDSTQRPHHAVLICSRGINEPRYQVNLEDSQPVLYVMLPEEHIESRTVQEELADAVLRRVDLGIPFVLAIHKTKLSFVQNMLAFAQVLTERELIQFRIFFNDNFSAEDGHTFLQTVIDLKLVNLLIPFKDKEALHRFLQHARRPMTQRVRGYVRQMLGWAERFDPRNLKGVPSGARPLSGCQSGHPQ